MARLVHCGQVHVERPSISGVALIRLDRRVWAAQGVVTALHLLLVLLVICTWLGTVLGQFPRTRVSADKLEHCLFDLFSGIGSGIFGAVPGMASVTVICFITRFVGGLPDGFFMRD